jgi:hypothetical protein
MHIVFKEMVSESNLITVPTLLHKDAVEIIDQWLLDNKRQLCRRVSSIGSRDVQVSVLLNIIFIYRGSGHFSTDANKQFFCEVVSCRLLSKSHWSMISTASLCSNVGTVMGWQDIIFFYL